MNILLAQLSWELPIFGGMGILGIIVFGFVIMLFKLYCKVEQGQALVKNGYGGTKVTFVA